MNRFEELAAAREVLMDAIEETAAEKEQAAIAAFQSWGSRNEASAQAALYRAQAHHEAALQAFEDWIASPDGVEYEKLDEQHGGIYG